MASKGRVFREAQVQGFQVLVGKGDAENDADSDVVVLTGQGKAFCAGGDLDWMQSAIDRPAEFDQTASEARTIIRSQLDMTKPLICRLNGHAIGLGATLALCCDAVVTHDGVRIADPHAMSS